LELLALTQGKVNFDGLVNAHDPEILSRPRMNTPGPYKNVGAGFTRHGGPAGGDPPSLTL